MSVEINYQERSLKRLRRRRRLRRYALIAAAVALAVALGVPANHGIERYRKYRAERQYNLDWQFASAVKGHDYARMDRLLNEGAQIDSYNLFSGSQFNSTSLGWAVRGGDQPLAEHLLKHGANPNAASAVDCIDRKDAAMLKLLLDHGGAATTFDLDFAINKGQMDCFTLLLAHKPDLNADEGEGGFRPLHYAVMKNDAGTVQMLIDAGAAVNQRDATGSTPLDLIKPDTDPRIAAVLLKAGGEHGGKDDVGK